VTATGGERHSIAPAITEKAHSPALDQGPETDENTPVDDRWMRKAISVRQPWAWAIIHGGKDVENRTRRDPWLGAIGQRVWIHAAKTVETYDYGEVRRLAGATPPEPLPIGALIGSVLIHDVHHERECGGWGCSKWSQPDQWHIVVRDPVPLVESIPCRGALGLFLPTPEEFK
jgi:hypothetical protein